VRGGKEIKPSSLGRTLRRSLGGRGDVGGSGDVGRGGVTGLVACLGRILGIRGDRGGSGDPGSGGMMIPVPGTTSGVGLAVCSSSIG